MARSAGLGGLALVLLITLANCAVFLFLSLFAVGGQGETQGVVMILVLGFSWIAILLVASIWLMTMGRPVVAVLVSMITIPAFFPVMSAGMRAWYFAQAFMPVAKEVRADCDAAGPTFTAHPAQPVHSIAYDWDGDAPPLTNRIRIGRFGAIRELAFSNDTYPASIEFTEERCCRTLSLRGGPAYVRLRGRGEPPVPFSELTADALVTYRWRYAGKGWTRVALDVTDRRDGKHLASLTYLYNPGDSKACGATNGSIDERAFVLQAVGAG